MKGMRLLAVFALAWPLLAQDIPRFRLREEKSRDYFARGLAFYNNRQYVAAREFFYKSLDIQPYFHLARRYLGDAYYYSGDWNAALEQWELLDQFSDGSYPLVRQRSDLLRFALSQTGQMGPYTLLKQIDSNSYRNLSFKGPVDIAIDKEDHVYLLSFDSAQIVKFSPEGDFLSDFSGPLWDRLKGPVAMALYDEQLFVADFSADRIRSFDLRGRAGLSFGIRGSAPAQFYGPAGIAVNAGGIYVADSGNKRIQKFDLSGRHILSISMPDDEEPGALAISPDGELYVCMPASGSVAIFDQDGNHLRDLAHADMSRPAGLHFYGRKLIIADKKNSLLFYDTIESTWHVLPSLRDANDHEILINRAFVARTSSTDSLYVAEYGSSRMLVLVPESLRISNFDMRIQNLDTRSYPVLAIFLTLAQRTGRTLRGLDRSNFKVYENDSRIGGIRIDNIKAFNHRANLVLIKENSKAMHDHFGSYIEPMALHLLSGVRISDRITVIRAGEQIRTVFQARKQEELRRREISSLLVRGEHAQNVNLGKALFDGVTQLVDALGPRHVLLITSGKYFPEAFKQYSLQRIIQFARAHNVRLDVITYRGEDDREAAMIVSGQYEEMTSSTGGRVYFAFDESQIDKYYGNLVEDLDDRYVLTYRALSDRKLAGRYVELKVEANFSGSSGLADAGYFIPVEE